METDLTGARHALPPLPIFPLPRVQLFPRALMPLHVFEQRYREMVRDCASGSGLIALPMLEPGYEDDYEGRPAVRPTCGLGQIVAYDLLPDGRSNIVVRGLSRARIVEELPPAQSYRVVRLETLRDQVGPAFDAPGARTTLNALAEELARRLPTGGDTLLELVRDHDEPGPLTDILAAALVTDADERQLLLETLDVERRVERLATHLSALIRSLSRAGSAPN